MSLEDMNKDVNTSEENEDTKIEHRAIICILCL